jgi:uncharacterized membrane protein YkvA (DUF1232 family)
MHLIGYLDDVLCVVSGWIMVRHDDNLIDMKDTGTKRHANVYTNQLRDFINAANIPTISCFSCA